MLNLIKGLLLSVLYLMLDLIFIFLKSVLQETVFEQCLRDERSIGFGGREWSLLTYRSSRQLTLVLTGFNTQEAAFL